MAASAVRGLVREVRGRLRRGSYVYARTTEGLEFRIIDIRQRGGVLQARSLVNGSWYEVFGQLVDRTSKDVVLGPSLGGGNDG